MVARMDGIVDSIVAAEGDTLKAGELIMRYTIFGESHGPAVGVVLEGVPAGLTLDMDAVRAELARRAPGNSAASTARRETDEPELLSGVFEGRTTGAPLCALIRNTDIRSGDYEEIRDLPRPSHVGEVALFLQRGDDLPQCLGTALAFVVPAAQQGGGVVVKGGDRFHGPVRVQRELDTGVHIQNNGGHAFSVWWLKFPEQ